MYISRAFDNDLFSVHFGIEPVADFAEVQVARSALTIGPYDAQEAGIGRDQQLRMSILAIQAANAPETDRTATVKMHYDDLKLLAFGLHHFIQVTPDILGQLEVSFNSGYPSAGYALNTRRVEECVASNMLTELSGLYLCAPELEYKTRRSPAGYK